MKKDGWLYLAVVFLCISGLIASFRLWDQQTRVNVLQAQITSLKKEMSEREVRITSVEIGMVKVQEVLSLHQDANNQQAKVDEVFLSFMKNVNSKLENR